MQRQESAKNNQFQSIEEIEKYFGCVKGIELNLQLVGTEYAKYRNEPYMYIIDRMGELGERGISPEMETRYCSMLIEISEKYHAIPYHNISHGFDVMRAVDKFLCEYKMLDQLGLTNQEHIHILVAAYAHDNGHQGLTNNFYINSRHELAIKYENVSPLENMHSHNLLAAIKKFHIHISSQIKELMVKLILATDNKHHFQLLNKIQNYQQTLKNHRQNKVNSINQQNSSINGQMDHKIPQEHKQLLLEMMIHTADLSSCGKTVPQYLKWNQKLYHQFKYEYQQQRRLHLKKYSFNFDLTNQKESFAKENLSFLNKMILPFFKQVTLIMPPFQTELINALEIKSYFQKQVQTFQQNQKQNKPNQKTQK